MTSSLTSTCIVQDDADDWKDCAATMASIYENSFITIAATQSADSNQGCFGTTNPLSLGLELNSSKLLICEQTVDDFPLTDFALLQKNGDWPLLRRAWVFQERRLSPRVLHFTRSQLVWECQSARTSEDKLLDYDWSSTAGETIQRHPLPEPTQHPFKYPFTDNDLDWRRIVTYYSRLSLTFDKDRLPAIAAIVERSMRVRRSDTYIAGMWANSLLYDAAWYRHEHGCGTKRPITSAPTWSWASIRGAVQFHDVSILSSVLLLGIAHKINGPAHVGEVQHASIQLRGPVLTTSLELVQVAGASSIHINKTLYKIHPQIPIIYRRLKPMLWCFEPDYDLSTGIKPVDLKARYPILMLWRNEKEHRWFGLVLRRVSGSDFERLGICHVSYKDTPSQSRTCQNMIDALPIGSLKIV
jgi:hypothetical protein